MKNIFLSLLIGAGVSIASVIIYTEFISLYGKGCYFLYVKLFFALSIIGGGGGVYCILYTIKKEGFICSVAYGILTSFMIFFLIGFIIVNTYGS